MHHFFYENTNLDCVNYASDTLKLKHYFKVLTKFNIIN